MSEETFSEQALVFVAVLIIYVLTSHVIERKHIPYIHESTIAILMGILTATFAKYGLRKQIVFSNQLFFAIILPPIIFSAGYSLRKSLFFQNFGMISFLGIIGTVIGFICLAMFAIFINYLIFQALTLKQILMLSSVLCATDTVAAMALIKPQKYPVLNAVLFGQGIINDAVAIILFGTVAKMQLNDTDNGLTAKVVLKMIFDFCYLFFFSLTFGTFSGFGLSYLFKIFDSFNKYSIKETSLILLNGYFTYLIGQLIGLSGIISLFTCAIIMGHYTFMNISNQSQKGTGLAFETVSYISEAFIFAYLGASVLSIDGSWIAMIMALMILAILPFTRAIMVYTLPLIYKLLRKKFPMNSKELKVCWYSGMVRGVIAFALCLQIKTQHTDFIITIALVIVMFTTIIGSTFLKSFTEFIQIDDHIVHQNNQSQLVIQGQKFSNYKIIGSQIIEHQNRNERKQNKMVLQKFQNKYIKPIFKKKQQNIKNQLTYQLTKQFNNQNDKIQEIQQNKSIQK